MNLTGSIELSAVPRGLFKRVKKKDGTEGVFLNISVIERREPSRYGNTHFIKVSQPTGSVTPEGKKEYKDVFVGDMKPLGRPAPVSPADVDAAPPVEEDGLPF